jgi:carotenoid cleavage dioxygenase-like enzyme
MPAEEVGALARIFRTTEELEEPEAAEVVGRIPEWVQGSFIRSGPGVFELKDDFCLNHIFDGYAVISKFELNGGHVTFDKKFLNSEAYQRASNAGRPCVTEYGTKAYSDPAKSFFAKLIPNLVSDLSFLSLQFPLSI